MSDNSQTMRATPASDDDYTEQLAALEREEAERARREQEEREARERRRAALIEAKRKADEVKRRKAEEEARKKAEEEARKRAEEEERRKAAEEADRLAEEARRRIAEEQVAEAAKEKVMAEGKGKGRAVEDTTLEESEEEDRLRKRKWTWYVGARRLGGAGSSWMTSQEGVIEVDSDTEADDSMPKKMGGRNRCYRCRKQGLICRSQEEDGEEQGRDSGDREASA